MQSRYTGTAQSASISGGSFQEQGLGSELHVFKLAHTETGICKDLFPRHSENNCSEPICLATQEVHWYNMSTVAAFPNSWMKIFGSPPFTLSSRLGWTSEELRTDYQNEGKCGIKFKAQGSKIHRLHIPHISHLPHSQVSEGCSKLTRFASLRRLWPDNVGTDASHDWGRPRVSLATSHPYRVLPWRSCLRGGFLSGIGTRKWYVGSNTTWHLWLSPCHPWSLGFFLTGFSGGAQEA